MKICKYCNIEIHDSEKSCSRCGASKFLNKCNNCGTVFESNFCPNCGIKANARPRVCSNCGNEYYTAFCPNCGNGDELSDTNDISININTIPDTSPKKKPSTGIILLWIFFLPIMGCIAIAKSKKLKTPVKIILIALIAIFTFLMGRTNDEDNNGTVTGSSSGYTAAGSFESHEP